MAPKVTIIGGGSSSFVPVLIRRLMQSEALEAARVSLMDIDEGRLGVMQALADKLIASEGSDIRVTSTLDQREALVGADFVIAAIAEGGMDAWANDLEIPGRHGIVMHVGDSIGPGGIMRAFRNAPALAQVARNAAEVAPGAYIFNYTNPAPIEALAMRTAAPQVKSFGLCSCAAHASSREWLARQAGVKPEAIAMPPVVAGINHCASIQELRLLDGTDAMPLVRARAHGAGRQVGARDLRRAAVLLDALDGVLPADAAARGALRGHGPGRQDALRHHDARHGLRARARRRGSRAWRSSGRRPAPTP